MMNLSREIVADRFTLPVMTALLFIVVSIGTAVCGAVQTKAHDAVGAGGLQPTREDKDAGLVGINPGFDLKAYQSELVRRIRDTGLFERVVNLSETPFQPGTERSLKLEGAITRLSGGSRALRFWVGFGAGRSKAQAETRFVDAQFGQVVMVTADRRVAAISEVLSLDYGGDSEGLLKQSLDNMAGDLGRFCSGCPAVKRPRQSNPSICQTLAPA